MTNKKNTSRKLAAGQPGTKRMVEKYGENLLCVRYRYDADKKIKYKTVEIIIDKGFWETDDKLIKERRMVEIKIGYAEIELRNRVKTAGGIWNRERKVWELSFQEAKALGLKERIISE